MSAPVPDGPVLEGIAPIVPVRDVPASMDFYTDVLGFELRAGLDDGSFALLARGEAGVILLPGDEAALAATANNISAYIWVSDLMALWDELKPRRDTLPEGRVRPPVEQPYGMREFHVKDPDGFLIFFGQSA
ncbi:MAG: VOC family protein [Paracoccaceae bacterium]|nr:VOC family protein [Paracoccaceae bacterium]